MLSNLSSNVVLAKARAMYGRRLTEKQYRDLLACHTVSEIAAYLKNNTSYQRVLSGINETDIHRGRLENLLRQKIFEDSASLCRYEITVGEHFAEYILQKAEIQQISRCVMHLMAGTPEEYLFSMPTFLNKHSRINLLALGQVQSFQDLLQALEHTPYANLLRRFTPTYGQNLDYFGIENCLYQYLYQRCFSIVRNQTSGETRRQLEDLFHVYADVENYTSILRLKFNYRSGPDFIKSSLLPFGTLKPHQIDALLAAETPEAFYKELDTTSFGKRIQGLSQNIDRFAYEAKYAVARKEIRFSTHPSVVLLSYMFLMEIELHDITNIIEGVRYQIPTEEIEKLLTIIHFP